MRASKAIKSLKIYRRKCHDEKVNKQSHLSIGRLPVLGVRSIVLSGRVHNRISDPSNNTVLNVLMLNKHFHYKLDAIAIYEVISKQNKTSIDRNLEMEIKAIQTSETLRQERLVHHHRCHCIFA